MTAQSFAAAFNRNANPKLEAVYATSFMREIEGVQAVIDGTAELISGVRVRGRYRLQIRLTKRLGDFTARLTLPFFCPVPPNTPVDPRGTDLPGSGPYYVAEHVVNQRVVLKRNPYYQGERPANVDQVIWTLGMSREDCLLAIEQDRIDHCGVPVTAFASLAEKYELNQPGGQLFVSPALTTWYLAFNHDRPAFKGPGQIPLKMAINFALDRPALVRPFGKFAGKRTDQLLPPALARAESIYPLGGPNLVAAKRWYARARVKPTKLVFYTANGGPPVTQALALEVQLKQLGIDLEVKYFDNETLREKAETQGEPFDIVRNGWQADYADGGSFLEPLVYGGDFHPTGNLNVSYFNDPQTNARIEAANCSSTGRDGEGPGKTSTSTSCGAIHPWRRCTTRPTGRSSRRASAASSSPPALRRRPRSRVQEVDDSQARTLARGSRRRGRRCSSPRASRVLAGGACGRGGTLRVESVLGRRLRRPGARRTHRVVVADRRTRRARSCSTTRIKRRVRRGRASSPRSCDRFTVSPRQAHVHVRAEADVPLPHRRAW